MARKLKNNIKLDSVNKKKRSKLIKNLLLPASGFLFLFLIIFLFPALRLSNMTFISLERKLMIFLSLNSISFLILLLFNFLFTLLKTIKQILSISFFLSIIGYECFFLSNSYLSTNKIETVQVEITNYKNGGSSRNLTKNGFWVDVKWQDCEKSFWFTKKAEPMLSKGGYILLKVQKGFWGYFITEERTTNDGITH